MSGQLLMFSPPTWTGLRSVTSLLASVGGPMHSGSPDGRKINQSGQPRVRANRSVKPVSNWEQKTRATYGRCFDVWLAGADLQQSLASKLHQRLAAFGSPEFELTWRDWDMQSGPQICALRASGRRKSDNGSTGWPTPQTAEPGGPPRPSQSGNESQDGILRQNRTVEAVAGWPTPDTNKRGGPQSPEKRKSGGHSVNLQDAVTMAGYHTPCARDYRQSSRSKQGLVPQCHRVFGVTPSGTTAPTEKPAALVLNPRFSLWLMGFPAEWASCGARAMQSCRNSRRNLSKRAKKSSTDKSPPTET
jgi:hypothetical protein